jgi:hypothetical protein
MRFTGQHPKDSERMSSFDMRMAVNEALSFARIQIIGAEFTRAGNIALTPHPPCTTNQLLTHRDIFGPAIAHDRDEEIVFEHDRAWYNVVVGGIQVPDFRRNIAVTEDLIWDELKEWNMTVRSGVKSTRLLCRPEDYWDKERASLLISFETREGYERVLREGLYAFGEHCRAAPYRQ